MVRTSGHICRSSTSTAAAAFAIATSASSNPRDDKFEQSTIKESDERNLVSSPATIRVLNVLRYGYFRLFYHDLHLNKWIFFFRHWISKHFQDFEQDAALRAQTIKFLESVTISPHLLPVEIRAASQLLRLLCREDIEHNQLKLQLLLTPPTVRLFFYRKATTKASFYDDIFASIADSKQGKH